MPSSGHAAIALSSADLRAVAAFAATCAERVLPIYERAVPGDDSPRRAVEAAWAFASAGPRSNLQRRTAVRAHQAAREAPVELARLAAMSAGDAAASAYLHPLARAHQVRHILGSAAHAVVIEASLMAEGDEALEQAVLIIAALADHTVRTVLMRYPSVDRGRTATGRALSMLDARLRAEERPGR